MRGGWDFAVTATTAGAAAEVGFAVAEVEAEIEVEVVAGNPQGVTCGEKRHLELEQTMLLSCQNI